MATENPHTPTTEPLLMSIAAAARLLGVDRGVVRRTIALGVLEEVVLAPGLHPRLRRADIEALVRGEHPAQKAASP
jgi:excisionase family DNA binding protein